MNSSKGTGYGENDDGTEEDSSYTQNFCEYCKLGFSSEQVFENHKKGKVHEMKLASHNMANKRRRDTEEAKLMALADLDSAEKEFQFKKDNNIPIIKTNHAKMEQDSYQSQSVNQENTKTKSNLTDRSDIETSSNISCKSEHSSQPLVGETDEKNSSQTELSNIKRSTSEYVLGHQSHYLDPEKSEASMDIDHIEWQDEWTRENDSNTKESQRYKESRTKEYYHRPRGRSPFNERRHGVDDERHGRWRTRSPNTSNRSSRSPPRELRDLSSSKHYSPSDSRTKSDYYKRIEDSDLYRRDREMSFSRERGERSDYRRRHDHSSRDSFERRYSPPRERLEYSSRDVYREKEYLSSRHLRDERSRDYPPLRDERGNPTSLMPGDYPRYSRDYLSTVDRRLYPLQPDDRRELPSHYDGRQMDLFLRDGRQNDLSLQNRRHFDQDPYDRYALSSERRDLLMGERSDLVSRKVARHPFQSSLPVDEDLRESPRLRVEKPPKFPADESSFHCMVCNTTMTGVNDYQAHVEGYRHAENLRKVRLQGDRRELPTNDDRDPFRSNLPADKYISDLSKSTTEESTKLSSLENPFHCMVCNTTMTGEKSYQAHIEGQRHSKNLRKLCLLDPGETSTDKDVNEELRHEELDQHDGYTVSSDQKELLMNEPKFSTEENSFHCIVCSVTMTSENDYRAHVEGQRHAKKLRKMDLQGDPSSSMEVNEESKEGEEHEEINLSGIDVPTEALAQKTVDAYCEEPLIGLQYITEYICGMEGTKYVCNMCECRCDITSLIQHCAGNKHRVNYMKENFMNYYTQLQQARKSLGSTKSGNSQLILTFANEIEKETGREKIKVKVDETKTNTASLEKLIRVKKNLDLSEALKVRKKKLKNAERYTLNDALGKASYELPEVVKAGIVQDLGNYERDTNDAQMAGYEIGVTPAVGAPSISLGFGEMGSANMVDMIKELSSQLINNEEEAELALQVSNTLTQALLRYRLAESKDTF